MLRVRSTALLAANRDGATVKVGRLGCAILFDLDFIDKTRGLADFQQTPQTDSAVLPMTSNGGLTWIRFR